MSRRVTQPFRRFYMLIGPEPHLVREMREKRAIVTLTALYGSVAITNVGLQAAAVLRQVTSPNSP
jgi:hypothetical protein